MGMTKRNEKEKDGKKSRSSSSSGSSTETEGKTEAPERRTREKSTDVEAVPSPRGKETSDRRLETKESAKDDRKRRRSRERRERTERSRRSESKPKSRRGRSPEKSSVAKLRVPDTRVPAHPTQPPPKKNRGGSGGGGSGGSKERCPICWQRVSQQQSGKDQHMWSNQICIAYQIWNHQKNKDWAEAKKQAKELKKHRASQAEAAPLLVSKETKLAAEKAHARTAAWVRSVSKQPDRVDSSSRSPARVKKPKAKRRPPSPTPSPPPPERRRKKPRSSSDSSSRPRRHSRRERRIVINVK